MEILSPREIDDRLGVLGYHGQARARRSVCLAAYRHIRRLRMLHVEKIPRQELPSRSNLILIGPTGCGKTYIIELLFGQILRLPYVITEMTRYTESGYVGDDVLNIMFRLVDAAHGNIALAECGVIALDEFDKIAMRGSLVRFGGSGSTKDVSGFGVQRELLKMLEGAEIDLSIGYHYGERGVISTRDIAFFAIGAFTDFPEVGQSVGGIGFNQDIREWVQGPQYRIDRNEAEDLSRFQAYGFMPELIARFDRIIPFQPLGPETLRRILEDRVARFKREFEQEGFELVITEAVYDYVVGESIKRKTGARGLDTVIMNCLEDVAFEHFGQGKTGIVTLDIGEGGLRPQVVVTS